VSSDNGLAHAIGWWFDPRTGAATRIDGNLSTSGTKAFTPTTSGAQNRRFPALGTADRRFEPPLRLKLTMET